MEQRKYAKVFSTRKLICFCVSFVSETEHWATYASPYFWHFPKISQISITNTPENLCMKFVSLDVKFFLLVNQRCTNTL